MKQNKTSYNYKQNRNTIALAFCDWEKTQDAQNQIKQIKERER